MSALPAASSRLSGVAPRSSRRLGAWRRAATWLAAAGVADSSYLLLFQTGAIRHLWCPFFGDGCERISGSRLANPKGVPDAIFGVFGYAALGALARRGPHDRYRGRPALPLLWSATAAGAVGVSAILTWMQWRHFKTFCFWCLTSAALTTAIFPLTLPEARLAGEQAKARRRASAAR